MGTLWDALMSAGAAFAAAALALFAGARLSSGPRTRLIEAQPLHQPDTVFLFEDHVLLDATRRARELLDLAPADGNDWDRLVALLTPRFPTLPEQLVQLDDDGPITLQSADGLSEIDVAAQAETIRVALVEVHEAAEDKIDPHALTALKREVDVLRTTTDHGPFLVWRQTRSGIVTWANRAYLEVAESNGSQSIWPPPLVFDSELLNEAATGTGPTRLSLRRQTTRRERWFDVYSAEVGDETIHSAVDVGETVAAEDQLRNFMQTLTKTFAHLTIGLAIFDRSRRLALFNPALTDLTTLPVDFLTARPTLLGFLDRLRDRQMIPEPKDYGSWRREIAALEAAATDGNYEATWSLPDGRTYKVSGRPHPDGAVAFLFEDISAEMSMTRNFRTELELGQAVIDEMPDAIAVFASNGVLAMTNRAYAELWGVDPSTSLNDVFVSEAARTWREGTTPTEVWSGFARFATQRGQRTGWSAQVRLKDGRGLDCRFAPLPGGATIVRFAPESPKSIKRLHLTA
ncbi:MAG: PAS-domain containing protein [Pseudomonadota bacterium]